MTDSGLQLTVPPAMLEAIAERAAALVLERLTELAVRAIDPEYLTVAEAAEHLRCTRQRIYDLLSPCRLRRYKDGTRVLIRRDELDGYLEGQSR